MNNAVSMARLDFYTLKSQSAVYFIVPVIAVFFSIMGSPFSVLGYTAAWLVLILNTNLFAIQEKYGLERLYGSLAVSKKSIVLGRYLSTMFNFLLAFFVVIAIGAAVSVVQGDNPPEGSVYESFCISFFIYALISAIQMPIYFAVGYTKGRILSMVPFLLIPALIIMQSVVEALAEAVRSVLAYGSGIYFCSLVISAVVTAVSYFISVSLYKRES